MSATNNVLMVRPSKFNFNNQTSKSNFFQKNIFECENELNLRVINEFENLVTILRRYQINVHVLNDNDKPKNLIQFSQIIFLFLWKKINSFILR